MAVMFVWQLATFLSQTKEYTVSSEKNCNIVRNKICETFPVYETTSSFLLPSESAQVEKPAATLGSQSQSSSSGSGSLNPSSGPPGSSASTVPVSPVLQSPTPPLLQDPSLLRQLLPALQTALQLNNASVDMAKINEGKKCTWCICTFSVSHTFP